MERKRQSGCLICDLFRLAYHSARTFEGEELLGKGLSSNF
jgi:hypothetical protein